MNTQHFALYDAQREADTGQAASARRDILPGYDKVRGPDDHQAWLEDRQRVTALLERGRTISDMNEEELVAFISMVLDRLGSAKRFQDQIKAMAPSELEDLLTRLRDELDKRRAAGKGKTS